MSQPVINLQDAHTFQLLFQRAGYEPPNSDIITKYPTLLAQRDLPPIDKSKEAIIAHIKVEQDKGGIGSFLKFAAVPVKTVSILHMYGLNQEGKYTWVTRHGELFITNYRILQFRNSKSSDSKVIDVAFQHNLEGVTRVWYEENLFIIRSQDWNRDIGLQMNFPAASLAQILGQSARSTASERYRSLEIKQDIANLQDKQMDAQSVLYQFFMTVIQNNQARTTSPQPSSEATNLLLKLKELKDAGLITEDEFDQKKKELLSRL